MKIVSLHIYVYIQNYINKMFMRHGFFFSYQLFFVIARMLYLVPGNSGKLTLFGSLYFCTGLKYCQSVRTAKDECWTQKDHQTIN